MYSTHNVGNSIVSERFIRILKGKVHKKMTANDSKSYLDYMNKLVDQYNNSYHRSMKFNRVIKLLNLNLVITKYKNIFSKGYTKNWFREMFITNSVLKSNSRTYRIKSLNGEKIIGGFHEKELLLSKL